ncbi:ribosome-recycling factor [Capsicum chacoense]
MSISIRRALTSYRSFYGALRAANFSANRLMGSSSSPLRCENVPCAPPLANFMVESRRSFAKGRRQREEVDDDYESATAVAVNIGPNIKATAVSLMEAAIDSLSRELAKLRTGRASAGMLDHIIVETGGVKTPLCRMAVISVLDPKTLSVNPYDPDSLKELEKAIIQSPLGLNPQSDNQRLIVPIPPLTKEHVQAVCKVVAKSSEDVKQSIRRARQKALDTMKKHLPKKKDKDKSASAFSEDDAKRLEKEIDDLTKRFIKSAEDMCKSKEREITSS